MSESVEQTASSAHHTCKPSRSGQSALPKLHRMVSRSLVLANPSSRPYRYGRRGTSSQLDAHSGAHHKTQPSQMGMQETLRAKEEQLLVKVVKKELPKRYRKLMNKKMKWLRGELPFLGSKEDMLRPQKLYQRKLENIRMAEKILLARPTPELTRCQTELFYQDQQNVVKLRRIGGGNVGGRAKTQPKKG